VLKKTKIFEVEYTQQNKMRRELSVQKRKKNYYLEKIICF
jgi:hypothetical protein